MARKTYGQTAKLCFSLHALTENRNGLVVDVRVDTADGFAERRQAIAMIDAACPTGRRTTLGADKGYDVKGFVADLRARNVTPHVTRKRQFSAIDDRTTRHPGYATSQRKRKRIEEVFGWDQDGRGLPQDALPRDRSQPTLGVCHRRGLQPGPHGETAARPGAHPGIAASAGGGLRPAGRSARPDSPPCFPLVSISSRRDTTRFSRLRLNSTEMGRFSAPC